MKQEKDLVGIIKVKVQSIHLILKVIQFLEEIIIVQDNSDFKGTNLVYDNLTFNSKEVGF